MSEAYIHLNICVSYSYIDTIFHSQNSTVSISNTCLNMISMVLAKENKEST